jgi:hypothetical protein
MATKLRSLATFLGALLVSACTHTEPRQKPRAVDFVLNSSGALEGTTVQISGYLKFGDDMHNLWSSKSAWLAVSTREVPSDAPMWNHCITLRGIGNHRSALLKLSDHPVLITGELHRVTLKPDEIEIGSCSEIGISVLHVKGNR